MKRRKFVRNLSAGALAAGLTACNNETKNEDNAEANVVKAQKTIKWSMVTTWPKNFQGLGEGAEKFASLINQMSGGRLEVKVFGAGELVPALQVFDAVSQGTAQIGHGASYYWKGKMPASPFFSAVPYGLNAQEMNAWILKGGGLELWQELYEPFGILPLPAGNTGVQMAGWFNKEINSLDDINGLKMRIPGLGGEVLKRAGGVPVLMPGGEVFTALETGVIDAAEWVGPYNDLAFGLYKAAKYYYYPGWHEPGSVMECLINKKAYEALPKDLQSIVANACHVANLDMLADFTAKNNSALKTLTEEYKVELRRLPDDVLATLSELSRQLVEETAQSDELSKRIYDSFQSFSEQVRPWHAVSEHAFYQVRQDNFNL